jgi:hypothetical protein
MTELSSLVLPIVLSAVFVFIASSIIHMFSPWHKSDYPRVPNEDRAREVLRALAIPPGDYMIPRPSSRADLRSPEFAAKIHTGPVMILTVMPNGPMPMLRNMALWFLYCLAVSLFGAYIAGRALAPTAEYLEVFRFAGATAFIGYAVALWQMSIWYRRAWTTTLKATIDGLIYACLTAGTMGWLWPQ